MFVGTIWGCSSGGYAGGGIESLSAASVTIDAGQNIPITSAASPGLVVSWALSGGTCSAGACGTLSNSVGTSVTYIAPAGLTAPLSATLVASIGGTTNSKTVSIAVNPDPVISGVLSPGSVGVTYSSALTVKGGTPPLKMWSISGGTLPSGLSLNPATGVISGTPTASGVSNFVVAITDSSDVPYTATAQESIAVAPAGVGVLNILGNPPAGTVGDGYTTAFAAAGGSAPYAWSISSGAVPSGLSMSSSSGVLSGTPTTQGTFSFTVQAQDASGLTANAAFTIAVTTAASALSLTTTSLPGGMVQVPYSHTIGVSGGTGPYNCSVTTGVLPAGLMLSGNCLVSGIPTVAGTSNLTVKAFDSSNPAATTSGPVSITITPASLALTVSSLPGGTVNLPYSQTIGVGGGTAPYTCSVATGLLPAGLALTGNCLVSGTPTVAGTANLTVKAVDSSNPAGTTSGPVSLTISPASLALAVSTLPNGMVAVAYSQTIGVNGGTAPYTCSITSGVLPAGLSLTGNCLVSGTPTLAGTANLIVKAFDSSNPAATTSGPVSLNITPARLALAVSTLPNGTVSVPYSQTIGVNGGVGPYTCSTTAGVLPAGLALTGNCLVSGTPTVAGTSSLTVKAVDSSNPAGTTSGQVSLTVNPAALALTVTTLPNGMVSAPYSQIIGVSGGTAPYTCSVTAGVLPAGLSLTGNCLVRGTPTVAGTANLTVKAFDSSNPADTTSGPVSLTITPATLALTTSTLPNGMVAVPYSQTIGVSGGTGPYACSVTAGVLPAGLALTGNCLVSGTPTVAGTSNLTVKAVDSSNPAGTVSGPVSLTIAPAGLALDVTTLPNGMVSVPYSQTIGVNGGTGPYTCSVTAGVLPAGLALTGHCLVSGTPTVAGTANLTVKAFDSSNPADTTSGPVSITITPATLALTTSSLPNGMVSVPYSQTIGVTGGTTPYTCAVTAGALPAGLVLGANCLVSGTPTVAGTSNLTVRATDSSNPAATTSGQVSLTIKPAPLALTVTTLPNGMVAVPYSQTIGINGGTAPYSCSITAGVLPTGLALTGHCLVSGTPTVAGTANLTVKAFDSSNPADTTSGPVSITITPATFALTTSTLPNGMVAVPYSQTIGVSGGTGPYACSVTAGVLPAGLVLGANCLVSGTPTIAGTSNLTVRATDSSNPADTTSGQVSLTITPAALALTVTTLPNGMVSAPYSQIIGVSGGTAPYTCSITAGVLPAGLTLTGNCLVSGTPSVAGTANLTVKAFDSSNPAATTSGPVSLTITPATLALTTSTLPNGMVSVPYSQTIGVSGGTAPYSCTVTAGVLPAGLVLGANCMVSGTPTVAGASNLTVRATDSSNPAGTVSGPVSLTITPAALALTVTTLPNGMVSAPYSQIIGVSGGTAPYTCSITAGVLPAGLALTGNCLVSGTPTVAGTSNLTVKVFDSGNPTETTSGPVSLTITPAALALTTSSLPNGMVAVPYSQTIGVSGGTAPYVCTITSGILPAGLMLTGNCLVSGTPTVAGTSNLTVMVHDASNPVATTSGPVSLTIAPATLALTVPTLPNGMVSVPYSQTIGVSGGTAPYTCLVTAGVLPAGLTLTGNCLVSGTPTVAGTSSLTVMVHDASNPAATTSGPIGITITAANPALTITSPASGMVGTPYTGTIVVAGGTGPYSCAITAGTLPTGLTINGCVISGTPMSQGSTTITVKGSDSSNPVSTATGPVTLTFAPASATLTLSPPGSATVATPYTGLIGVHGGTGPYSCVLVSGTLPVGLTMSGCAISGTPTTAGSATIMVTGTDSSNPPAAVTGPVVITVLPIPPLTLAGSLPNATLGAPYTQTLTAAGGVAPYHYTLAAGTLPAGLTLSTTGTIGGTPTAVGASSFMVQATDAESTPQTANLPLVLLVTYPTTPNDSEFLGPYAYLFQGYDDVVAGVFAYQTATVGSFTADGTGVLSAGELDANHQASAPTGNTISSSAFLGTYTVGTDHRGSMTITTLNADGTVAATSTYAIALKAPQAPSTTSVQGSLIEFDSNQLQGTKGSGTLLAQQPGAFAAGLSGSYAFGISGDTPCLPTCTIGLIAGPAAAVGQFNANGAGLLSAGSSDVNIATTNLPNAALSGTYGTADGNGRVQLTMSTEGALPGVYPTDYAVYVVSASQAFILSTDKHSDYVLLAGSAELQTQVSFSDTSMSAAFIGYENSATNPGLVSGLLLQNVLNLSTATIFRGTGSSDGNCQITNVDTGGTTGLLGSVTGLLGGSTGLSDVLGAYSTTGATTCGVTAANGRGVLHYPAETLLGLPIGTPPLPRVFYLSSPNRGYFLETAYAGLGRLEAQTGAPFSDANTFTGTYLYESIPASSLASTDSSGIIQSNGAGQATSTLDMNVGVGTINVLQLGTTMTQNYTPPGATTGRFTLNGNLILYAITPDRFVLVDSDPLITSPSIAILY